MDVTKVTRPARKLLKLRCCGAVIVAAGSASPVSYTHLTLPTICSV